MLISQGSFRVCKNHNVIMLILLTLLEKLATLLNLLKKSTTFKKFIWARAQVCHVHPTPMVRIPPRAKFVFHNLLYFIEWNVKKLFYKLI